MTAARGRRVEQLQRRISIDPDGLTPAPAAAPDEAAPTADPATWTSCLDDPKIVPGRHGYRSFYIDDEVFARFRAAVYWLARREDADGVPENMSAAVEDWMLDTARDLEERFHEGRPFRATPDQTRRRRSP